MNETLAALPHAVSMAAISGIEAHGVSPATPVREEKGGRAAVEFGAAVTHQDLVREKLRVDPAALADRARAAEQKRESPREKRLADDKEAYRKSSQRGHKLDITV